MRKGQLVLLFLFLLVITNTQFVFASDATENTYTDDNGNEVHSYTVNIPAGSWEQTISENSVELTGGYALTYQMPRDAQVAIECVSGYTWVKWYESDSYHYAMVVTRNTLPKDTSFEFRILPTTTEQGKLEKTTYESGGVTYEKTTCQYSESTAIIKITIYKGEISIPNLPEPKEVTLTAQLENLKITTGQEVVITGSVTYEDTPISSTTVKVEILKEGTSIIVAPQVPVNTDGSYVYRWKIESTATTPPTGPESWTARVTSQTPEEYEDKTLSQSFQVLQLWLETITAKVVQITLAPYDMGGYYHTLGANREAGVRIYYRWTGVAQGFSLPPVTAEMEIKTPTGTMKKTNQLRIDHDTIISDFVFTLPEGTYPIEINLDPNNLFLSTANGNRQWADTLFSKEMKEVNLVYQPIDMPAGWSATANNNKFLEWIKTQTDFINDVYPIPEYKFSCGILYDSMTVSADIHDKSWLTEQLQSLNWLGKLGSPGSNLEQKISSMSEEAHLQFKKTLILRQLSIEQRYTDTITVGVLPDSTQWWGIGEGGMANAKLYANSVLVRENTDKFVSAHEVGHTFGLYLFGEQYNDDRDFGIEIDTLILKEGIIYDLSYPYVQADYRTPRSELSDRQKAFTFSTTNVYCFMGSGISGFFEPWASVEASRDLYINLRDPPQRCLYVSGIVFDDYVAVDPWYIQQGEPHIRNSGDYTIFCCDVLGNILSEAFFGNYTEFSPFGFIIAYPEETKTIEIRHGDNVLYSMEASLNTPILSNIETTKLDSKKIHVTWETADIDGDSLTNTVYYSYDNGDSWICVSPDTTENEYTVDLSGQPGGQNCLIRVYSSDGINTGEITSSPFNVESNAPIAAIFYPMLGELHEGVNITLEGMVYDLEDGIIGNPTWSSSVEGYLGSGSTLEVTLSTGPHTLTLTGVDSEGNIVETQSSVNVVSQRCVVVNHVICNGVNNGKPTGIGDVFDFSSTVISYLQLANASIGDQVDWLFSGPNDIIYSDSLTISVEGEVYAYSTIDISERSPEFALGEWTATVSINGLEVSEAGFSVEELPTGYVWWAPFVGAAILIVLGIIILKKLLKPKPPPVPPVGVCPTCGNKATWIPQYSRWYCYNCEKYLE